MNPQQLLEQTKKKFSDVSEHFSEELKKLRTGRAHAGMLDGIVIEAYGQHMPLKQLATVSAPEPQLLQISPYDPATLQSIASAIRDDQSLGLNPVDDGRVVRIQIPPLTSERRQEIVKQLHQKVEDAMISLRQHRHDTLKTFDEAKKDKDIGEDDHKRYEKQLDDLLNAEKNRIDELTKTKEAEILQV